MNNYCDVCQKDCIHCYKSDMIDEVLCGVISLPIRVLTKCSLKMNADEKRTLKQAHLLLMKGISEKYRLQADRAIQER
jgi:hypothetical protein